MFYVHILKSDKDKDLYIGSTNDLKRRLLEHDKGKSESTKYRKPFKLVYYEAYLSEDDVRRQEHNLKLRGQERRQLKDMCSKSLRNDG